MSMHILASVVPFPGLLYCGACPHKILLALLNGSSKWLYTHLQSHHCSSSYSHPRWLLTTANIWTFINVQHSCKLVPVVCNFLTSRQWEPFFIPQSSRIPFGDLSNHNLCPSSSWVTFLVCIDLQAFRQSSGANPSLAACSEMVFCLSSVCH